jgi:FkbM family methyltransferase
MYSQNNEQEHIDKYFEGQVGTFLDIGAYDGKTFSNTLSLLEKNWKGILVEPSPSVFLKLVENTKQYNPVYVNCAVATESKIIKFYDSNGDAISSFDEAHVAKWEAGYSCKFSPFMIKTITIEEILRLCNFDVDFINLDVEGLNFELFEKIHSFIVMGHLKNLRMLCVEHDGKYEEIESRMSKLGFRKILFNGENIILAR